MVILMYYLNNVNNINVKYVCRPDDIPSVSGLDGSSHRTKVSSRSW